MCGIAVLTLSVLIIADVIVAAVIDPGTSTAETLLAAHPAMVATSTAAATVTPVPTSAPTPTASPTQRRTPEPKATSTSTPLRGKTDAAARRAFRTYWSDVVQVSVSALRSHDAAGSSLRSGDVVAASVELKKCQDIASSIARYSFSRSVDTGNASDREVLTAVKRVGDGLESECKSARAYLDTNDSSDFDATQARFSEVVDGLFQAEALARSKYERLGGNPGDLRSFKNSLP